MERVSLGLFFKTLIVFFGSLPLALSLHIYIADSEFWAITLSKKLGDAGDNISVYYKIPFYALLKPLYWLPMDDITHILTARFVFGVIAVIAAILFFRTAKKIFGSERTALVLTALLVLSTPYLTQSFRVRSDCLALVFHLLVVFEVWRFSRSRSVNWIVPGIRINVLTMLTLVTTPKAIMLLVASSVLAVLLPVAGGKSRLRKTLFVALGFFVPPFQMLAILQVISFYDDTLYRAYLSAVMYFIDSLQRSQGNPHSVAIDLFGYVILFAERNPILTVIFLVSFALWIYVLLSRREVDNARVHLVKKEQKALSAYCLVSTLMLLGHTEKLPFFIYSYVPILLLGSGLLITSIQVKMSELRFAQLAAVIFVFVIGGSLISLYRSYFFNSNETQRIGLRYLAEFLEFNQISSYYDVIGLLPRKNEIYAFVSRGDSNNRIVMRVVEKQNPEVVFYVNRMLELEPRVGFFLSEKYKDLGSDVWIRSNVEYRRGLDILNTRGEFLPTTLRFLFAFDLEI